MSGETGDKGVSTEEAFPHMTDHDWAEGEPEPKGRDLIPGYDYDPTPKTLVEVYGAYLNPTHVASVWDEEVVGGRSEWKQERRTVVRMDDGQIFHFKESVEQVVAAINGEMR